MRLQSVVLPTFYWQITMAELVLLFSIHNSRFGTPSSLSSVCVCMCVYVCGCVYTHTHTHTHTHTQIAICVCVYIYIYIYIYTHTHPLSVNILEILRILLNMTGTLRKLGVIFEMWL